MAWGTMGSTSSPQSTLGSLEVHEIVGCFFLFAKLFHQLRVQTWLVCFSFPDWVSSTVDNTSAGYCSLVQPDVPTHCAAAGLGICRDTLWEPCRVSVRRGMAMVHRCAGVN